MIPNVIHWEFSNFENTENFIEKTRRNEYFNQLWGVWKSDETLFGVFDIASAIVGNTWRNSMQNFTKFYDFQTSSYVIISIVFSSRIINKIKKGRKLWW